MLDRWSVGGLWAIEALSGVVEAYVKKDGIDGQLMRTFFGFDSLTVPTAAMFPRIARSMAPASTACPMWLVPISSGSIKKSVVNGVNCVS